MSLLAWITRMLQESSLARIIPKVRRLAIIESMHGKSRQDINQIFLECLVDSPYIPNDRKNVLAEAFLNDSYESLSTMLELPPAGGAAAAPDPFIMFRQMVLEIFSSSKVISQLPLERKRQIGALIHRATTIEQLKELTVKCLVESVVVCDESKNLIANDVFDHRYDKLLLPNRFDCDEQPRTNFQERPRTQDQDQEDQEAREDQEDGCPICLMDQPATVTLPCAIQHKFCSPCIRAWAQREIGTSTFKCPLCRAVHSKHILS